MLRSSKKRLHLSSQTLRKLGTLHTAELKGVAGGITIAAVGCNSKDIQCDGGTGGVTCNSVESDCASGAGIGTCTC